MEENDWWISFLLHFFFALLSSYTAKTSTKRHESLSVEFKAFEGLNSLRMTVELFIVLSPPANQALV